MRDMPVPELENAVGEEGESGFALVFVLWIVAVLALQISLLNVSVSDSARLAENELAIARGEAILLGAVELAVSRLQAPSDAAKWRPDGAVRRAAIADAQVALRITDENGRIDLNMASEEVLTGLFSLFVDRREIAAAYAERILDWRDPDHDKRPAGAEDDDYIGARHDYGASDGPFIDVTELSKVLGMPPQLSRRVEPFVTVHSRDGRINLKAATETVLRALPGISAGEATELVKLRKEGRDIETMPMLTPASRWISSQIGPFYRIETEVTSASRPALGRAVAIIHLAADGASPFRMLTWRFEPRVARAEQDATPR